MSSQPPDGALLKNRLMAGAGEPLLSPQEVCALLGCNERQLEMLLSNGALHRAAVSGDLTDLIPAATVKAYLTRKASHHV